MASVAAGLRDGYTWTSRWKFDVDDAMSMRAVYNKLGDRTMYVVATTNRTLSEFDQDFTEKGIAPKIDADQGIGLWRRGDGTVMVDDIVLFFGPSADESWALSFARRHGQESILAIDGRMRTFKFLEVP